MITRSKVLVKRKSQQKTKQSKQTKLTKKKQTKGKKDDSREQRAKIQRIFLMQVEQLSQYNWMYYLKQSFKVLGTSGNTYKVTFSPEKLQCSCIDFKCRGKTCKHIYFIVCRVALDENILEKMNDRPKLSFKQLQDLDNSLLNRLQSRMKEQQIPNQELFDISDECVICFEDIDYTDVITCPQICKKFFHKTCIDKWLEENETCPLCRKYWEFDDTNDFAMIKCKNQNIILQKPQYDQ